MLEYLQNYPTVCAVCVAVVLVAGAVAILRGTWIMTGLLLGLRNVARQLSKAQVSLAGHCPKCGEGLGAPVRSDCGEHGPTVIYECQQCASTVSVGSVVKPSP